MPVKNIVRGQKVSQEKILRAKELRHVMTAAEALLWHHLRANRLRGWHFRRQQIIAGFVVDFYCHAAQLIIEIDGPIHLQQREQDAERDAILREHGFRILRFTNEQMSEDIDAVLHEISRCCVEPIPPAPLP